MRTDIRHSLLYISTISRERMHGDAQRGTGIPKIRGKRKKAIKKFVESEKNA